MATSLMMNTNDNNVEQSYSQPVRLGRRKAKNEHKKKNKEPQRGMGVEKLERMRIQEIMKNPLLKHNNSTFVSDPNMFNAFQYSNFGGFPNGQMGMFGVGPGSNSVTSFGSKTYMTEISNEGFLNKNEGFKCQFEYCTPTSCKKKKRFDDGNMGFGTYKVKQDMDMKICSDVGDNHNNIFNQEYLNAGFKTNLVHQVGYATRPGQPGVEVLAVHKKVPSNQESRNLVMEYEFFPGCKKESKIDEFVMMEQNKVAEEASSTLDDEQITTCLGIGVPGPGFDASIDLSLKLSY